MLKNKKVLLLRICLFSVYKTHPFFNEKEDSKFIWVLYIEKVIEFSVCWVPYGKELKVVKLTRFILFVEASLRLEKFTHILIFYFFYRTEEQKCPFNSVIKDRSNFLTPHVIVCNKGRHETYFFKSMNTKEKSLQKERNACLGDLLRPFLY